VTLQLQFRIVEPGTTGSGPRQATVVRATCTKGGTPDPAIPRISIFELEQPGDVRFLFSVYSAELGWNEAARTDRITGDRRAYVETLYRRIEAQWLENRDDEAAFQRQLRAFGSTLWDELVPEPIRAILWEHRHAIEGLAVTSEEPFIPWELVHLKPPGQTKLPKETVFLGQLGLTRWLYGTPRHKKAPLTLRVDAGRARTVVPTYADPQWHLAQLPEEAEAVRARFDAVPVEAHTEALQALLEGPAAFDLLHFAGHGVADISNIQEASIRLTGRLSNDGAYVDETYSADTVRAYADLSGPNERAPIVVLNACQAGRLGTNLTSVGGFADAFLAAGAGMFVSSLWMVHDLPARTFVEALYDELLAGQTVASATKAARERARDDGDATWLAYVVYADPGAKLVRG
jgi:hypothetical protein